MEAKKTFWPAYALSALVALGALSGFYAKALRKKFKNGIAITSSAFEYGQFIPLKYTGDGEDLSPPLRLENVPTEAKSLALIVEDPDTPGGNFCHWLAWNIDPKTEEIAEGSRLGGAVLGINDFQKLNYAGPCPASGLHRYYFKVFALDTILDLPKGSSKDEFKRAIEKHTIAQGSLMGKYLKK